MAQRLTAACLVIVGLLCAYLAATEASTLAKIEPKEVRVLSSQLYVDWWQLTANDGQPNYWLILDLETTAQPRRQIHWEGRPLKPVYPEEALDELAEWAPGLVRKADLTGDQLLGVREHRLHQLKAGLAALAALALLLPGIAYAFNPKAQSIGFGVTLWWIVYLFGLLPLAGTLILPWQGYAKLRDLKPVQLNQTPDRKPFDAAQAIPRVTFTPAAMQGLAQRAYKRYSYQWATKTYHLGADAWTGPLDEAASQRAGWGELKQLYIDPADRWNLSYDPGWWRDVIFVALILLLFGLTIPALLGPVVKRLWGL